VPRAKADYRSITRQLVEQLDRDGLKELSVAQVNIILETSAPGAELGRVLQWFRRGRVSGWTLLERKGQPIMGRTIIKLGTVAAKPKEQMSVPGAEGREVRKPEFGPDVIKYIPSPTPRIQYHPRRIGDGKNDVQVLTRCWEERRIILLVGKPGTGKSTVPWVIAQELGIPIVRISMDEAKDPSKILGQWVPAEGGGFRFVKAPALQMYEEGGLLVIEEVNAITPGVAFTLHPMLDDLDVMVVDDLGIVARRHPDFWVVGTMNPSEDVGAAGTQQVNYALWDRFKCKLFYGYDTAIEAKLVKDDERILKIRDQLRGGNLRTEVTTRMLRDFYQNINIFGWEIAKQMFVTNFPATEREIVTEACKLIGG
jgi:hypothetical protein